MYEYAIALLQREIQARRAIVDDKTGTVTDQTKCEQMIRVGALEEAVTALSRPVDSMERVKCPECGSTSVHVEGYHCASCNIPFLVSDSPQEGCATCDGTGALHYCDNDTCPDCDGTGRQDTQKGEG